MKKTTLFLARTAMLLALTLLFQSIRIFFPALALVKIPILGDLSILVIGTLVNLVLYVSVKTTGIYGALLISIIAPIVSLFQGHIPFPQMVVVVALGNSTLVFIYWLITKKEGLLFNVAGIITASVAKFLLLFASVKFFVIPMLTNINEIQNKASLAKKPVTAIAKVIGDGLSINFSWPQIVTALLGGVLLLAIIPALKMAKVIKN